MRKQVLASVIGILLVLSVFSVVVWQIKPVGATEIFSDGFETGDLSAWTGTSGTPTVSENRAHHGSHSVQFNDGAVGERVYKTFTAANEIYASWYENFDDLPTDAVNIAWITGSSEIVKLHLYKTGAVWYWRIEDRVASTNYDSSTRTMSPDVWYYIELRLKAGTGADGVLTLWVNSVVEINQTGLNLDDNGEPSRFTLLEYWMDSPMYADCVVINTAYIDPEATGSGTYGATVSYAGQSSVFYSSWFATLGQNMSHYIFGSNNTGTFTNDTAVSFSDEWGNATKTLNATAGVIQWEIYANDSASADFLYSIGLQNLTTTYAIASYSSILLIGQKAGQACHLNIQWTAVGGATLSKSILRWNNSGSFVNETAYTLSSSPAWHNFTGTANSTVGNVIVAWFYANNTLNQWTQTVNVTFVTYINNMALHTDGASLKDDTNATVVLKGLDYTYFIDGPLGSWMTIAGSIQWNTWNEVAMNDTLTAMQGWGANCIRVLATSEWWLTDSSGFRAKLQTFISSAKDRGIYVAFTFWRNNASEGQVAIPYSDPGNGQISSQADFINMWASIITSLRNNSNVIFEPWNEPTGSATWYNVSQQIINYARNYTASIVVYGGPILGIDFDNYLGGSIWTMGYAETYPANDTIGGILFTGHFYRNCFYYGGSGLQAYNYENMTWALEQISVTNFTAGPLWIGELGFSNWASDSVNETAWFNNTLSLLNSHGVGYCDWAAPPWVTGTQWGIVQGGQANYVLTAAGNILKAAMQTLIPPTVTVTLPEASTYSSSIPVSFSASGGTIDQYWFNALNGSTWVYVSNQTYAGSGTVYMTGFVVGSYTGYFWANNTAGNIGQATVVFSVSISGGTSQLIVNVWWGNYW